MLDVCGINHYQEEYKGHIPLLMREYASHMLGYVLELRLSHRDP